MDTFDVPEFRTMPEIPEEHGSTPLFAFINVVLTSLLNHAPAMVHAEAQDEDQKQPIVWFIRPLKADPEQKSLPIAASGSRSYFRASLARFGHHYMQGQLYNGYSLVHLRQGGFTYRTYIYMSNGGAPGFWIKIFATRIDQPLHADTEKPEGFK